MSISNRIKPILENVTRIVKTFEKRKQGSGIDKPAKRRKLNNKTASEVKSSQGSSLESSMSKSSSFESLSKPSSLSKTFSASITSESSVLHSSKKERKKWQLSSEPVIIVSNIERTPEKRSTASFKITPGKSLISPVSACIRCVEKDVQIEGLISEVCQMKTQVTLLNGSIESLTKENTNLRQLLLQSEDYRKFLHTCLQEVKGNIRVVCRIKPSLGEHHVRLLDASLDPHSRSLTLSSGKHNTSYVFDKVFSPDTTQIEVFQEILPFVQSALDGDSVCIFSYGQTGSGKTYTLEGDSSSEERMGIIPRAAAFVFSEVERQQAVNRIKISISCMEIYMDKIRDLFSDNSNVKLCNINDQVVLPSLEIKQVSSSSELLECIELAIRKRSIRETHLNSSSSRSHCVYTILIEGSDSKGASISGKLNIIDLAGSEKSSLESYKDKTESEKENMKLVQNEAKYINTSLSCLRRVINSLVLKKYRGVSSVVPYRDSKLTLILKDSLSSKKAKVVLIINLCPENYSETKETLKFATEASLC